MRDSAHIRMSRGRQPPALASNSMGAHGASATLTLTFTAVPSTTNYYSKTKAHGVGSTRTRLAARELPSGVPGACHRLSTVSGV
jgi:hypothetical protein